MQTCGYGFWYFISQFLGIFVLVALGFIFINIYFQSYKPKMLLGAGIVFMIVFGFCAVNVYSNGQKFLNKIDPSCQQPITVLNN
jgi:hypothetical protein